MPGAYFWPFKSTHHQRILSPQASNRPPQIFSTRKQRTSNMEASTENLDVSDLSFTDEENHQIVPNIEESLGKRDQLSSADKLLLEYLCKHEPVFNELNDVRNKVRSPFRSFMVIKDLPTTDERVDLGKSRTRCVLHKPPGDYG